MNIKGAIFDMDGTLTDSMHVWSTIGSEFIKSCGKEPRDDVDRRFTSMSVYDAVDFMQREYGISGSRDEVTDAINKTVERRYLAEVPLKDGVEEFLSELHGMGVKMCVATATDKYLADAALTRLGIRKYFGEIFTSRSIGAGKEKPDIFYAARDFLGTEISETAVFEDSYVAIDTAKAAGFPVCGLYDLSFAYKWDYIKEVSDIHATSIREFLGKFTNE